MVKHSLYHLCKRRNNKGPKIEPSGTPQVIGLLLDVTLLKYTNCFLLVKAAPWDENFQFCQS